MTTRPSNRLCRKRDSVPARRPISRKWLLAAPFALVGAAFGLLPKAHGFFEIARGELILNTTAQATYDSNIYARDDADSDLYLSLIPELQYLRKAGRGTIDLRAGVNITRFLDFGDEDFEDFHAGLEVTYPVSPDSPLAGKVFAGITEQTDAHDFLNTRVKSRETGVGAETLYRFSDRLGFRNTLAYEDTDVDGFSGTQTITGSVGLQWLYSEKLSFFTDYRLQSDKSDGDDTIRGREIDNLDHAILFGAIGVLRPRLEGVAAIGFQRTDSRADERDRNLIVASVDLEWAWRPKTTLALGLSRELDVSPTDETVERTDLVLTAAHDLNEKIRLTARTGYRHLNFNSTDRQDNAIRAGAGIDYIFTRYWNAGADVQFTVNSSSRSETDYDRQVVQIFTRYSF